MAGWPDSRLERNESGGGSRTGNSVKLKPKIWLLLGALLSVVLAVDLTFSYHKLKMESRAETEYDARTIYGFMMATRRNLSAAVHCQRIAGEREDHRISAGTFVLAHFQDFSNWNRSGIIFNNVTDRPRNPKNLADRFELEAMRWFGANPKETERMRDIVTDQGVGYMLYTAPIRIEPFCLKCHGERAAAPPAFESVMPLPMATKWVTCAVW